MVLTPREDLRELDYQEIEAEEEELLRLVDTPSVKNGVVDLGRSDYVVGLTRFWPVHPSREEALVAVAA